jgi:PAS domain S-box-containing protein
MRRRSSSPRARATASPRSPDERLRHVIAVLKAIRNVNQLIVRETDPQHLLQGVCDSLIETRGYYGAWVIGLENGKPTLEASAGVKGQVAAFRARLDRGQLPECAQRARRLKGVRCVRAPAKECGDCPLAAAYTGRAGLAVRLSRGDRLSGILGVSVPAAFAHDKEEHRLLREVADDVALALEGIALAAERERAVEELRRGEERFRLAAVSVTDLVYEWDIKSTIIWYGDVDSLMGYPAGGYPRTLDAWAATLHPDDLPRVTAAIDGQLKGAAPYAVEYRLAARDGGWRWWSARGTVLRDGRGEPRRWIGAVTDITDRKRAEESAARTALELRIRDRVAQVLLTVADERMYEEVLAIVLEATESRFGVFGYLDEAGNAVVPTMTRAIWDQCQVPEKSFVFPRETWGDSTWVRAIREKRTILRNESSSGTPKGHIPISRHISLPLIHQDGVVGYLQVANKEAAYSDEDVALLEFIGKAVAPVLDARLKRERQEAARKRAEEDLRKSEARYRSLVDNIPEKVFMKARDCRWVSISENFARDLGIRPEDAVGKVDSDFFPKELADKYRADDTRIMETGESEELEEQYLQEGRETWVRTLKAPVRDEDGAIVGICGVFSDITERKRAEEALRQSERRFRELMESLPQLVWTCRGDDGTCDYLGPQWVAYTGIPEADQLGFRWLEQLHPDDRERAVAEWNAAAGSGSAFEVEFRIRRHDGVYRWFKTRASPLRDREGRLAKWLGTNSDIEDQKRAEAELQASNEGLERRVEARTAELQAANAELEAFTYSVSHDLRAPLRQADGFAKILLDEYGSKVDAQALHYLERVRQGTRFMGQLVDELLSFSRLGRRELTRQVVGLDKVLQEALEDLKPALEGRRIEWRIGQLPWVECDPTMMRQVFVNLLSNAIKFTRPREGAVIEVGSTTADGCPEVFVRDNGVGFSMKYADKLFTVFQRLHRQEDFEGTGIGLAIVQRIIHKHGGRVWAESEVDKGAAFHFTLSAAGGK